MVKVTTARRERIERDLGWSLWRWRRLPQIEVEIDEWDQPIIRRLQES